MSTSQRYWRTAVAAAAMVLGAASIGGAQKADASKGKAKGKTTPSASHFKVTAPDFVSKGRITLAHVYNGMGCGGQNTSSHSLYLQIDRRIEIALKMLGIQEESPCESGY